MSEPSISIPLTILRRLSEPTRREIESLFGLSAGVSPSAGSAVAPVQLDMTSQGDGPADLTVSLARKLIAEPISPKTVAILRAIAESPGTEVHFKDVLLAVPGASTNDDLRGSWSGITRRVRNILDDAEASLIWWEGEPEYDKSGNYIDQIGRVSPLTRQSLRAVFGLRGE